MNIEESPKALITVKDILLENAGHIRNLLPSFLNEGRFISASLALLREQPQLMTCTPESFFGALVQCAQLGLTPGVLGLAYFAPFWNNKQNCREVVLIPGYKGLMQIAWRSNKIARIDAHVVYEQDRFDVEYGTEPSIKHVPGLSPRGGAIAYYAIVRLTTGEDLIHAMDKEEVEAYRIRYSKALSKGEVVMDIEAYGLKTCVRKAIKFAPQSTDLMRGVFLDEAAEAQIGQTLASHVFDWKGLDKLAWDDSEPTEAEAKENNADPFAVTAPPFGAFANKPLSQIPDKVLQSYKNTDVKNSKDPTKARYHEMSLTRIAAIDEVMAQRRLYTDAATRREIMLDPKDVLGTQEELDVKREALSEDDQAEMPEVQTPMVSPEAETTKSLPGL